MTTSTYRPTPSGTAVRTPDPRDPAFQAFWLLRIGFTVAPILFGLDGVPLRPPRDRDDERSGDHRRHELKEVP